MGDWQIPCLINAQGPESKQIWQVQPRHRDGAELSSRCGGQAVSSLLCNPHLTSDRVAAGPPSVAAWPGVFCLYLTDSVECAFGPAGDAGGKLQVESRVVLRAQCLCGQLTSRKQWLKSMFVAASCLKTFLSLLYVDERDFLCIFPSFAVSRWTLISAYVSFSLICL